MPRANSWSDLKIGLLALISIVALALAVLMFARIGALHGDTKTVYMVTDEATRVINGTEVWLAGQRIGLVKDVSFRPPTADTTERIAIEMDILEEYLPRIRRNSDVQIRPGGNLIGEPVVYITVGTASSPPIQPGDTLHARAQVAERSNAIDAGALGDSVSAVIRNIRQVATQMRETRSAVADVGSKTKAQVTEVRRAFDNLASRGVSSKGSISQVSNDLALRTELSRVAAMTDSIRATMASRTGTFGRFRRDSTLLRTATSVMARVDTLRERFSDPASAITGGDPSHAALTRQLSLIHVQLDSLVRDLKHNPFKYLPF